MRRRYYGLAMMVAVLGFLGSPYLASAQTDGTAALQVTLRDYNGSGSEHWAVAWVTTEAGAFIKTLWRQGPSIGSSHWNSHCREWYNAKSGSSAFDGYSSATAFSYSPPANNPVDPVWNCRDAANQLVPDGNYRFWVQYAEDNGQGPFTTGGLLWTKGEEGATVEYPDQGGNFVDMQVAWVPDAPPTEPPVITSAPPPATGVVGVPYLHGCTASGTMPIGFSATGLPTGLAMNAAGTITGIPAAAGTFAGSITATNGTPPDATQAFSIVIDAVPVDVTDLRTEANNLVLTGSGPAHGVFSLLVTTNLATGTTQWTVQGTNTFDAAGTFSITNAPDANRSEQFYRLRVP